MFRGNCDYIVKRTVVIRDKRHNSPPRHLFKFKGLKIICPVCALY